jgi:hypothetical protein
MYERRPSDLPSSCFRDSLLIGILDLRRLEAIERHDGGVVVAVNAGPDPIEAGFPGVAKSNKLELSDIDALSAASMSCRSAVQQPSQLKERKD